MIDWKSKIGQWWGHHTIYRIVRAFPNPGYVAVYNIDGKEEEEEFLLLAEVDEIEVQYKISGVAPDGGPTFYSNTEREAHPLRAIAPLLLSDANGGYLDVADNDSNYLGIRVRGKTRQVHNGE